jgi:hypothetical protein
MPDKDPITKVPLDVGIHGLEPHGSAKKQDGFFHKGVLQAMENDHVPGATAREVKVIANGHCHSACLLHLLFATRNPISSPTLL